MAVAEELSLMRPTQLVILVHGIRTRASWVHEVAGELRRNRFEVAGVNYGRFGTVKFLLPIERFRQQAVRKIERDVRTAMARFPGCKVSYIAHSFGSYALTKLLQQGIDIRAERVIFCGSVVPTDFEFEQFILDRVESKEVFNEVGTHDVWPAMAEAVTCGYGPAGTYGFNRPIARDRVHVGFRHSDYLNKVFCRDYWVPYLLNGTLVEPKEPEGLPEVDRRTPRWFEWLRWIKWLYVLLGVLLLLATMWVAGQTYCTPRARGVEYKDGGLIYLGSMLKEQKRLIGEACESSCPACLSGLSCRRVEFSEQTKPMEKLVACVPAKPFSAVSKA